MKILDEKGRLFGRLSVLDLFIAVAAAGMVAAFLYRSTAEEVQQLVNADDTFYVTISANKLREFTVNAIAEGDLVFRQHDIEPLGKIVKYVTGPATDYMLKGDGTIQTVPMEERFAAHITVECTGSIRDAGYYVGGTSHIAEGNEIVLVSNRVQVNDTKVSYVGADMPS